MAPGGRQRRRQWALVHHLGAADTVVAAAFSEQYWQNTSTILQNLRSDAAVFGSVAELCADAISAGRSVFANLTMGHMPSLECDDERRGNPCMFTFNVDDYGSMQRGDVLLTHAVNQGVVSARQRGCSVVAFTCPYVDHSGYPRGQINPSEDHLMLEDVADLVVLRIAI